MSQIINITWAEVETEADRIAERIAEHRDTSGSTSRCGSCRAVAGIEACRRRSCSEPRSAGDTGREEAVMKRSFLMPLRNSALLVVSFLIPSHLVLTMKMESWVSPRMTLKMVHHS